MLSEGRASVDNMYSLKEGAAIYPSMKVDHHLLIYDSRYPDPTSR